MAATGTEIASAYVSLITKMPGVQGEIQRSLGGSAVRKTLESSGNSMGAILAGAVGGAAAAATSKAVSLVTGAIDGAVKRVDTLNSFPKIMKNLGYSAADAEKSIKRISDGLAGLPTTLDGMAGTVQQLAPLTGGLDEATGLALALNNAMLAGGKSTDIQANAMEQYTQMLALGKVDMAAWRSMVTAMPGQMDQLSVSILGAGNKSMDLYESLKNGTVTFDQFNGAVMKLNTEGVGSFASFEKQALDSTDGIGTGWANLQTAITRNLANIIQKLKPAIDAFLIGATTIANAFGPVLLGVIDIAVAVGNWAAANRDWLGPATVFVGTLLAVYKGTQAVRAITLGYQAAMKGAQIATFLTGGALKTYNVLTALTAAKTKVAMVAQTAFNTVLKANPLGIVITAVVALVGALVYFFSSTETGKAVWAGFVGFLSEAWANISQFFQDTWTNVLKPVFEGIGQVLSFVWESILKPVFDGIATVATWLFQNILQPAFLGAQIAFAILGGIFQGVWEFILKPVFDAIGAVFKFLWDTIISVVIGLIVAYVKVWAAMFTWLWVNILQPIFKLIGAIFSWIWSNVIQPIVNYIKLAIQAWGIIFQWLWANVLQPIFKLIGDIFSWVWNTIISPIVSWIQEKIAVLGLAFRIMYEQYIKPAWDAVSAVIKTVWEKVKSVIDTMVRVIQSDPKKAFEAARDAIGTAWDGIRELARKPVKFVVETVIGGMLDAVNGFLPSGMKIPKPSLPKGFARGGILPGMSRMSDGDDQLVMARRGEGMMVSEALRSSADRSAFLAANAAGRRGVGFASMLQGLARGGLVNPLPMGSYSVSQPYHGGHNGIDLAAASGTKVFAAADGVVGLAGSVPMGGNEVYVQHTNGLGTRYSHLSRFATTPGTQVKAGNVIGYVGSTGMSTGPHLHYMVHNPGGGAGNYGAHVNPAPYLGIAGADLGGAGGAASILDGLVDFAVSKVKGAFPEGGMWIDIAAGLAKNAAETMAKAFNPFAASDGHTMLYDNGGWLQPGRTLVENKTGRPERILTDSQWDAIAADRGTRGPVTVFIGDREFEGWMDDRADAAVYRGGEDQAAMGRFAAYV